VRLRPPPFAPGESAFACASAIGADASTLDLEDAVRPPKKPQGRAIVALLSMRPRAWAFFRKAEGRQRLRRDGFSGRIKRSARSRHPP